MLSIGPKGKLSSCKTLPPAEDQLLRQGFGRYAMPAARITAAAIIRQYQHREGGMWFYCDCLPEEEHPPALVPVNETHVRRHTDPPWPAHDDDCDFFRDASEQHRVTSSYRMPAPDQHLNLIKGFGGDEPRRTKMPLDRRSYARSRLALARLLARLVTDAGLQTIAPNWKQTGPAIHYEALWSATKNIELAPNVPLSVFIGLSAKLERLELLKQRINAAKDRWFTGSRPHGVLVFVAQGAAEGRIMTKHNPSLLVRGKIAIFGEREGHRVLRGNQQSCRPPYLAICLIARPDKNSPAEVLKAYLHPCRSAAHLIMLDSDHERETLNDLLGIQRWLQNKCGVAITIEKPLFDIGPDAAVDAQARPPCLPDFILRVQGEPPGHPVVIVETMGYADQAYRERKARMHAIMSEALQGAPVVEHYFGQPEEMTQEERNRAMGRKIIKLILNGKRS